MSFERCLEVKNKQHIRADSKLVHLHSASVLEVSVLKLSLGTFGMERISLAVFSSATRVCTMLSFQELTFWESYHRIPHPGALSQEVNKVPCGSVSCTISNKPQARICSGCSRNIGVVANFSKWDAIKQNTHSRPQSILTTYWKMNFLEQLSESEQASSQYFLPKKS